MKHERRIPTIAALLLLILSMVSLVTLVEYSGQVLTRAEQDIVPKEIRVTNVSDTSVSISWLTATKTSGSVIYGEEAVNRLIREEREGESLVWQTHYLSIRDLKPQTTYNFKIISGNKTFADKGKPFTFTTSPSLSSPPPPVEPAYGKVIDENNQPAWGALLYLTVGESAELSTIVKPSGEWLIAVSNARTDDGGAYYSPKAGEPEIITVQAGVGREARAITDTDHHGPVPTIIIGKTYNFQIKRQEQQPLVEAPVKENVLGVQPTVGAKKSPAKLTEPVAILVPRQDGAFATTKPLFRGTGIPGHKVVITLESLLQKGEVIVSADGTWFWSPPENLNPGEHTLAIQTTDEKGRQVVKSHRFIVHKSGTQVLGQATPSATLTPTVAVTPTTTLPIVVTATPWLTATPTLTVAPTPIVPDSGTGGPPVAGYITPTVAILASGIVLFFFGLFRFLSMI